MRYSLQDTNRCVMCGMCLPHCPTYGQTLDEGESPRGRIALMRALDEGTLRATPRLVSHLDSCLQCRACEHVCPAQVPFGPLMDLARARLPRRRLSWRSLTLKWSGPLLVYRGLRRIAGRLASGIRRTGVLRRLGLRAWEAILAPARVPWPEYGEQPRPGDRPCVALFTGCVAEIVDRDTLQSARRVLEALAYQVVIPREQVCCGAIHQHNGRPETATRLIQRNTRAFDAPGIQAIVSTATGCGAFLREAGQGTEGSGATELAERHRDIMGFLAQAPALPSLTFRPSALRVAVHTPCTLAHVLREPDPPFAVLNRIPELEVVPLAHNERCCGAAGTYMLTHPSMADSLIQDKVKAIQASRAEIVVTSNVGCRIHLQMALARRGLDIEVVHPVTLLARQLIEHNG